MCLRLIEWNLLIFRYWLCPSLRSDCFGWVLFLFAHCMSCEWLGKLFLNEARGAFATVIQYLLISNSISRHIITHIKHVKPFKPPISQSCPLITLPSPSL
jgi:hypothetical protein